VYHYHLHVVYIPVVEKQILWSKRCKDEALRGTVKETIMQVSRSKKWGNKPILDADGKPMLNSKGKQILKSSYSVLQDDYFQHMRSAGYLDVERGERFSTEEHLTITQFKVLAEKERLAAVTGQVEQAEQELDDVTSATEEQKKKLAALKKESKVAQKVSLTVHEIEGMGKKNPLTGNISMTAEQCDALKRCAITGIAAKAENSQLRQKLTTAEKSVAHWKQQYETLHEKYHILKKKAQPYLDALEIASEKVRAFIDSLLVRGKQEQKRNVHKRGQEFDIQ